MTTMISGRGREFVQLLEQEFPGEVRSNIVERGLFSTDASIYLQMPLAAFAPKSNEELRRALVLAHSEGIPVLPRAGGTSLAGQTTALDALVLDISKHLHELEEVNESEMWARVQPGLVRDRLNGLLAPKGIMFAPETSTSNRANIGGMIGNNSSGMMSIRYGTTISHVEGLAAMLADGTSTYFGRRNEMDATGQRLLDGLLEIVQKNRALIEEKFPKVIRRVGGYSLDHFLTEDPNLAKILVGAEGTLAFITSAKVRLVPKPPHVVAVACHFADQIESLRAIPIMLKYNPLSVEFMDGALIDMCRDNPTTCNLLGWLRGHPEAVLPVELDGATREECEARAEAMIAELNAAGFGYDHVRLYESHQRIEIIETRKHGLGVMLKAIGDWKAISFIEDACVPVEHLPEYAQGVIDICTDEGLKLMTYGHASVGVLHLKPVVNLKDPEVREKCARISKRAMELCKKFGGSWSGEHGDGIARGAQNELFWGPEMIEVFRQVKRLFDPKGILNPGKIFDTPAVMGPLRYTNGYEKSDHNSMFHYRDAGGFVGAVEMCNGVGACRKLGEGTMCPSYMATRDEKDSTRGRANALRMALAGQLGPEALTSHELHDVLDLCLECKACATECPSNVDMAKMKAEFLHAYHARHGATLRDRIFAHSPDSAKLNAGLLAPIVNKTLGIPAIRRTMAKFLRIAEERKFPVYAEQTFTQWFDRRKKPTLPEDAPEVVIFEDTFMNYHEPEIGKWAVRVLEQLGFRVILSRAGCCARTFISKGFLDEAKKRGERTLDRLDVFARKGLTIVTFEPSCASSLRNDLPDLMDDVELGKRVSSAVMSIEHFIAREIKERKLEIELPSAAEHYLLHGHCHQKALLGTDPIKSLLGCGQNGKPRVCEVDSGCCGMAGSFGYEQEHYDISQTIGEQRLFPAVRAMKPGTPMIANGFSCRHQVEEGTGVKPMHFIEALGRAMKKKKG